MIKMVFYTYVFVRWTGGWGVHTGLGAWTFLVLWTGFVLCSIAMAALGPSLTIVSIGRLFGCDGTQILVFFRRMLMQPAGRALIMGHWGTMALTALICYFAYYLTGSIPAAVANPSGVRLIEWVLAVWYVYQVYSFVKIARVVWTSLGE